MNPLRDEVLSRLIEVGLVLAVLISGCAVQFRPIGGRDAADVGTADAGFDADVLVEGGPSDADVVQPPDADVVLPPDADVVQPDAGCPVGQTRCAGMCVALDRADRCGSCTNDCTRLANVASTGVACVMGACAINTCAAGFANCNGTVSDGCETPTTTTMNCGACARVCSATLPVCSLVAGTYQCASGCMAPEIRCGTTCTNTATDASNCGACGTRCMGPSAGSGVAVCRASMCAILCAAGFHLCGTRCEPDNSTTACGTTCSMCTAPMNATPLCASGMCSYFCTGGTRVCPDGSCQLSSPTSCGAMCSRCASVTNGTATCMGGVCGAVCDAGYMLVGGACVPVVAMPCGNRTLDAGETCDDGNTASGDGCSATCQMESNSQAENCSSTGSTRVIRLGTGISYYTGTTAGAADDGSGSCTADGPEVVMLFSAPGGTTAIDVTLASLTGRDVVLRGDGPCSGTRCINTGGGGVAEMMTLTTGLTATIAIVADTRNNGDAGPFSLRFNVR